MASLSKPKQLWILQWIELAETAHFDARRLASLCRLSSRQLQREFRRCLDRSPQDWLNEQRIKAARQLLLSGLPVKRVAYELGFKQPSHFSRQFKEISNETPSEFVWSQLYEADACRPEIASVGGGY